MKKIIIFLIVSLISYVFMSLPVYADTAYYPEKQVTDLIEKYDELYKSGNTEAWERYWYDNFFVLDDVGHLFLYESESYFKNKSDKLIEISCETLPLAYKKEKEQLNISDYNLSFWVELYSSDDKAYASSYIMTERTIYSIKEIIRDSGIDDSKKIGLVCICETSFSDKEITGYKIYDYTPGWNTIDGNTYYITSDGTIITKSVIIDDVRYKFTKDGVCHGKYSGFTRSKNGLRYYKDGVIIKNKCIRFTDGRIYIADKDGYLTKRV